VWKIEKCQLSSEIRGYVAAREWSLEVRASWVQPSPKSKRLCFKEFGPLAFYILVDAVLCFQ